MKRFNWLNIAIFFIVVGSLLPAAFPVAFPTVARADAGQSNLQELTQNADSIVVGTVTDRSSYWNDAHTQIYTSVAFSVEDKIKGGTVPDNVTITVSGGTVGDLGEWVSDAATFDQGEKAVVFVKKLKQTKSLPSQFPAQQFEVYQGFKGKFPIKGGKIDSLPVTEFKGRLNSILSGQTLPATELDIAPSVVTMPYSYLGYRWPASPALPLYYINENTSDCTGEGDAVRSAAATWSAAGANFSFTYAGPTTAAAAGFDGANEIMWVNLGNVSTIAVTYIWYSGSTILENDIMFNDTYNWSTSPVCPPGYYDVQSIGLHEFGHWLALNDLYDSSNYAQVMYGYGYTGTTKRALTADDIAGIRSIYGLPGALAVVTSILPDGAIGIAYSQTLQAIGGTGSYTWSVTSGSLPDGLTPNSSTGLISGTPTTFGTSNFTVQVNDGSTTVSKPLSITVVQKLTGNYTSDTCIVGGNYINLSKFTATATGTIKQIKVYGTAAGNVKVAIYSDSGGQPGSLLNANNSNNPVYPNRWNTISIADTLFISGTAYWLGAITDTNYTVTKVVSPNPYRYKAQTYSGFGWPGSLTGLSTSDTIYLCIAGFATGPTPLTITTTTLPDGERGVLYSQTLQAIGGSGTYTWSIISGALPTGLSPISSGGLISGTPTTAATSNFTVQVNDGSTTASQPLSIYISPPHQKLLGSDDVSADGPITANYISMSRFQALQSGNITSFRVRATGSGNVKVAIYADISGEPGPRLGYNDSPQAVTSGWTSLSIPSTPVTSGNYYWLAINSDATVATAHLAAGSVRYKAATFSGFGWPDPAGSGYGSASTVYGMLAGWGTLPPAVAPVVTNSTGASNITATAARLNGEVTSTGGENPTVHIYWGASDGVMNPANWTNDINLGTKPAGIFYYDISSLTTGTPYYYRCFAQNSAGQAWASSTATFTPTNTVKLIGSDDVSADGPITANYISMSRFQALQAGNITSFRVRANGSGNIKVAIYSDISGEPGPRLGYNDSPQAVSSGWTSLSIPSTPVTSGNYYWLAVNSDATVANAHLAAGSVRYKAATFSGFSWPDPAGSGYGSASTVYGMLAGWGTTAAPVITAPVVTNSTGPSNITATAARLNGEVTSTGGENPTVHIYWGASDGVMNQANWTNDINLGTKPAGAFYSDISSLTTGTPYFYRCFAQNSAGQAWASSTATFTPANTVKLIGSDDVSADGPITANYISMSRFQALQAGNITSFSVRASGSGNIKVAIYSDISGEPGPRLGYNDSPQAVSSGWTSLSIPSTPVTSGNYYWLAINSDATVANAHLAAGSVRYKAATFSGFSWPDPADSGYGSTSTVYGMLAGWGTAAAPVITAPVVTNSTGPSNITATAARLNGEVTSTGGENPTVHIYWGASDGVMNPANWTNDINLGTKPAGTFYSDISSLTTGTPYYYRCFAQNSAGQAWASSTATFTPTNTVKLIGSDDVSADGPITANYISMSRFQALQTGNVTSFRVRANGSGNVKVAIYADISGEPGPRLGYNDSPQAVSSGWTSLSIPSTAVTSGTYYWLAINSDATVTNAHFAAGSVRYKAATFSGFSWPDPAGSGYGAASTVYGMLAGWGTAGP